MQLYVSNHLEDLVAVLAERVAEPSADGPLSAETIAVQGPGMQRWLAMQLSRRLGVWAHPRFPFPRHLIELVFRAVLGPEPVGVGRFEPQAMTWRLAQLLPDLLERDEFAALRSYLRDDELALRRIQLAARIAESFDRYLIYRPEMIRRWDRGAGLDGWQPILWRALVGPGPADHLAARAEKFLRAIEQGDAASQDLPRRLHLFGLTTLPPLYVDVLAAVSKRVETNLFQLGCTRDPEAAGPDANPLWASLGSVGRDFRQVLASRVDLAAAPDLFRDPGRGSRLARLKRCLLEGEPSGRTPCEAADRSIQIHACHGPMREVEVLHDQLTRLFEQDESLQPGDVLVMTPDIASYAPFIGAVFGSARFPCQIADRGDEIVEAFSRVLDVLQGRLTATAVADLMMVERVRRHFGFEAADLDVLLAWIEAAGIRWGVDAAHRSQLGQPATVQNTWRQGLDRLLLGLALPADGVAYFADLLPADGLALGHADLLGRFAEFCEALFTLRERLQGSRSVEAWSQQLVEVLEETLDRSDDVAEQHALIRAALSDLAERAKQAGFSEEVGLASVRRELMDPLEGRAASHRFLSGGVTFCEMVPMRSIPFRVVALLGMSDEAFPRKREPQGFDLMPASRRPGDRTRRDDDRYLFLEALVSAGEQLLVTYPGRSVRDGSEREPSVVIGELLDELGSEARAQIVTAHPLQPFSPSYFDASHDALFSYSSEDCAGAQALLDARAVASPRPRLYVPAGLSSSEIDEPGTRTVELARLGRFFEHPVRAFLQARLGLYLRDEVSQLEDREPMELDALARWTLGDRLLTHALVGTGPERAKALMRAQGLLPLGSAGDLDAEAAQRDAAELAVAVRELQRGEPLPPIEVDLSLAGWRIVGELGDLWPAGRVSSHFSKLPHASELSFWIQHLVLGCVARDRAPTTSFLVARERTSKRPVVLELSPLGQARERLADLLALYSLGGSVPLPLLPKASRAQADFGHQHGWAPNPVSQAIAAWEDDRGTPAERNDPYLRQAFRDVELLQPDLALPGGEGFASLAQRVYQPYLLARTQRK